MEMNLIQAVVSGLLCTGLFGVALFSMANLTLTDMLLKEVVQANQVQQGTAVQIAEVLTDRRNSINQMLFGLNTGMENLGILPIVSHATSLEQLRAQMESMLNKQHGVMGDVYSAINQVRAKQEEQSVEFNEKLSLICDMLQEMKRESLVRTPPITSNIASRLLALKDSNGEPIVPKEAIWEQAQMETSTANAVLIALLDSVTTITLWYCSCLK